MELVEDGKVGAARVAEDGVDAILQEGIVHESAAREPRELQVLIVVEIVDRPADEGLVQRRVGYAEEEKAHMVD